LPTYNFGLGFLPDGNLLVALMTQRLILKFGAEKPAIHADLTDVASGYLRDLAVARDGNAYVTSFDADASGPDGFASARVLLATPDGNIRSVADNITHPNGLAITSSHDLLVAETLGNRLLGFKIDSDGALLHRKVFADADRASMAKMNSRKKQKVGRTQRRKRP
jgi:sugar lactone lactonase YvrE